MEIVFDVEASANNIVNYAGCDHHCNFTLPEPSCDGNFDN